MAWKNAIASGSELVLVTSSKTGRPNANVVISKGFVDGKLLINNCQMSRTIRNINANPAVCIVARKGGEYYRITGKAKSYASGKHFVEAQKREKSYPVKSAVIIRIENVFDLDKAKQLL